MASRVRSYGSPAGGWELAEPAGSPAATGVCGFREWGPPVCRREVPHPDYTLVLSFGDPLLVDAVRHTSFLAGLSDRATRTAHAGAQHGIELRLPPATAQALLRRPLHELANAVVALPDLLGVEADGLVDRLASTPDWERRFALLDGYLAGQLADAPPLAAEVHWALEVLTRRHGRVPVGRLARATGWSQRHFTARFREQVGLAPKAYARVLRFHYAYRRMLAAPEQCRAQIAADAGYYDQPHLNRDFRDLAGLAPGALFAAAHPGGLGIAA